LATGEDDGGLGYGKVTKVEYWTDALFSLYVRAPVHPFTAGQFTKLGLEIDGERVQRAYSYVNAPGNPDLEFYLVTVPDGKLSPRLAALKPGDEVRWSVKRQVSSSSKRYRIATPCGCWRPALRLGRTCQFCRKARTLSALKPGAGPRRALRRGPELSAARCALEQRYAGKLRIQTVVSRETVAGSLTGRCRF
jgi:ferredoxin--NADP+ reductase